MNISKIMTSYGFENGEFDDFADVVMGISEADNKKYGYIEGEKSIIDTDSEFINYAYQVKISVKSNSAKKTIEKELPKGKTGALKLCTMWLKKRAENLPNAKNYQNVINLIKKESKVNDKEIYSYYKNAISKEILILGKKHLGKYYSEKQLKNDVLKPIINYYLNPDTKLIKPITDKFDQLRYEAKNNNSQKHKEIYFMRLVGELNKDLRKKVSG